MNFGCNVLKNVENIVNVKLANFPCVIQIIQNSETLQGCFATKLDNCMKFKMLFPDVLIDFPNSKVCLLGEWSTE